MPKFKCLIIDPPWPYEAASSNDKLTGYVTQAGDNSQYDTLTIEDLAKLPIDGVMDKKEAYVFLWTTSPFLPDALYLLKAWNFEYVTAVVWHKNTGIGVGFWFRGDHEYVLVAKRKGAPSIRTMERSLFASPRLRHSAKPNDIHELIEKRREPYVRNRVKKDKTTGEIIGVTEKVTPTSFPEGPYLEIFARRSRPGWTILGNQAEGDGGDIRETLPRLIAKIEAEDAAVQVATAP